MIVVALAVDVAGVVDRAAVSSRSRIMNAPTTARTTPTPPTAIHGTVSFARAAPEKDAPHSWQNRAAGGASVPQAEHVVRTFSPHSPQNFPMVSAPHLGHRMAFELTLPTYHGKLPAEGALAVVPFRRGGHLCVVPGKRGF